MDDQVDDRVVKEMEKESDLLAPTKPNKLLLKLKFRKTLERGSQHVCPVCNKGFISGKALGGHIRIHMKGSGKSSRHRKISKLHPRNIHRSKAKKRIPKNMVLPKATNGAPDLHLSDEEGNEKVTCCVCNKGFRSMKSLFGHMRKHPERAWRGIRPPPSDKNSFCSSVSKDDDALEVDQISCATEKDSVSGSDNLLESLPKWTNTAKRCGKFTSDEDEIPEAAYCLMKLARGDSFDLGQSSVGQRTYSPTDRLTIDNTRSWDLGDKSPEEKSLGNVVGKEMGERKGKAKLNIEWDQERDPSECSLGDSYSSGEEKKMVIKLLEELNGDDFIERKTMERENTMKVNYSDDKTIEKNRWFDQFQKFSMMPDEEEGDPSTMEVRYVDRIIPSSQTPGSYPKNPLGGLLTAPAATGEHLYSKTLFPNTASDQAAEDSQVSTPKMLDFDLNEPYVAVDAESTGT
ncbi:hypothetical protein PTKIN_Ptkin03bG0091900 [Pterospermum kingtungense]